MGSDWASPRITREAQYCLYSLFDISSSYKVLNQREPELSRFGSTPGSAGNFFTGDFALFLTSRINEKASVLSEIIFSEHREQPLLCSHLELCAEVGC
jgi:hypothetical protein